MTEQAEIVVIGGGIGGLSALYHLTQEGITDCLLVERDELTSGTTWHSAAQVTNFGGVQTMVGLKSHSIRLYRDLADDPDHPINYHHGTGGLRLASTEDHLDGYRHFLSMAKGMGVGFELIDPAECRRRHPLITTEGLAGALWDPLDGDIDPAQLCQALARRARAGGARIRRHTEVTGLTQMANGHWRVETPAGAIEAGQIVNAAGYRCNEVGAMMGVTLPVVSMEHQYFLTEPIAAIGELGFRVPLIRCPTDDFYSRQEKTGLLVGFYEQDCRTWGLDGIDPGFTMALCPDDLDRISPVIEGACRRLPCLAETGIHSVVNGPITYTADGLPLVGRVPGRRNAWCITGLRAGLGEGGGHGWLLAQMIAHGEAEYDSWCLDPRRFTRYADIDYTAAKAIEDYRNEFRFHMPHEHRPAGRPARTTPLTPVLAEAGAAFAVVNGWERAGFFRPDPGFEERLSFRFSNAEPVIAAEVGAVRDRVGLMEVNGFTRIEIAGEGVPDWLDRLICGRVPRTVGRVGLGYFLTERGNVLGEATLAVLSGTRVWWGSAAAAEWHDLDWLADHLPADGSITLTPLTETHSILVLAGPRARAVLQTALPEADWSAQAFPWLSVRRIDWQGAEITAMSISFSGELAWELHVPMSHLVALDAALMAAGAGEGLARFGLRAAESMRLEKGYRHWKADLITEYDPFESGLGRFVRMEKDFVGKPALARRAGAPPRRCFVSLAIECDAAPAQGGDSILAGGAVVGTVTSAGWGHRTGLNLAMGFVDPAQAREGTALEVEVLGRQVPAQVIAPCPYDPQNARVRGQVPA